MLLFLGIDSQFTMVEVIVTTIEDEFNYHFRKYVKRQEYLVMIVCALTFFVGVIYYTEGGIYFFTLVDYFAAGVSLMYIAFFEVIAVVWFYGGNRLSENIKEMTGKKAHLFFIVCWYGISPTFIVKIKRSFVSTIADKSTRKHLESRALSLRQTDDPVQAVLLNPEQT
ncbi:unnamed protein product [Rotaria magnacalcarata]|uniref:Uncharacterized protein n=1 Tax=Rotaria magnacalcarata TaxID=392030 RepID=A0A8S2R4T6_9BILA|nr:unnamed protein product [Rotaria magnacalcarata]